MANLLKRFSVNDERKFWINSSAFFLILFFCVSGLSLGRHEALLSSAYDLGIFNQAMWLITNGQEPFSTFIQHHILADHASFVLYIIALPYALWQTPEALLVLQAAIVSSAIFPLALLCRDAGLLNSQIALVMLAYCLFPPVINISLFDFHPDILVLPLLFLMLLGHARNNIWVFLISALCICASKEIFGLSILAYGLACVIAHRDFKYGLLAIAMGASWFMFATRWVIPYFSGNDPSFSLSRNLYRFNGLGDNPRAMLLNAISRPWLFIARIFSARSFIFAASFIGPIAYIFWGGRKNLLFYLIASVPTLLFIILSVSGAEVSLSRQYCLPLVPYAIMLVKDWLVWINSTKAKNKFASVVIIIFTVAGFVGFTRALRTAADVVVKVPSTYVRIVHQTISQIPQSASVYTSDKIASQLSGRRLVEMIDQDRLLNPRDFNYVLIDNKNPGWLNSEIGNSELRHLAIRDQCSQAANNSALTLYKCKNE